MMMMMMMMIRYQKIKYHLIFDIKIGENFRRYSRYVVGGHTTETPASLTYSSRVSSDSVRISFLLAALNGLDIKVCDIQNAYLTADCRERSILLLDQSLVQNEVRS